MQARYSIVVVGRYHFCQFILTRYSGNKSNYWKSTIALLQLFAVINILLVSLPACELYFIADELFLKSFMVGVFYQVVFTISNTLFSLSKLSFGFILIS